MNGSRLSKESLRLTVLLILVLAASAVYLYIRGFHPLERTTQERIFSLKIFVKYKNGGTNIWNFTKDDFVIGLFMNTTWQTVYLTQHSSGIRSFERDENGNYIAILNFSRSQLPPEAVLSYEVEFKIVTTPRSIPDVDEKSSWSLDEIPQALKDRFCGAEGPWQVDDPEIIDLARRLEGNETNVLSIVKTLIRWVKDNIRYSTRDLPRYPNETLKEERGDCDDQANLLITLCRVLGIPAYLQMGCIYLPSQTNKTFHYWDGHQTSTLMKIGWHGWAMVYIPPWGWLPVDLTYAKGASIDPLNTIKNSAITLQETIQYLNITKMDYIAWSRNLRNFLIVNDFYIHEYHEMTEEIAPGIMRAESKLNPQRFPAKPILLKVSSILKLERCEGL